MFFISSMRLIVLAFAPDGTRFGVRCSDGRDRDSPHRPRLADGRPPGVRSSEAGLFLAPCSNIRRIADFRQRGSRARRDTRTRSIYFRNSKLSSLGLVVPFPARPRPLRRVDWICPPIRRLEERCLLWAFLNRHLPLSPGVMKCVRRAPAGLRSAIGAVLPYITPNAWRPAGPFWPITDFLSGAPSPAIGDAPT